MKVKKGGGKGSLVELGEKRMRRVTLEVYLVGGTANM